MNSLEPARLLRPDDVELPSDADAEPARDGFVHIDTGEGKWFGLLTEHDCLALLEERPAHVELVFTGRWAPPALMERADLVTEMREVKHYYRSGVSARAGIEY